MTEGTLLRGRGDVTGGTLLDTCLMTCVGGYLIHLYCTTLNITQIIGIGKRGSIATRLINNCEWMREVMEEL